MSKRQDVRNQILRGIRENPGPLPAEAPVRSAAYIARVGQELRDGLAAKVSRYEQERETGGVVLRLDPKRVGGSRFANRHGLSLAPTDKKYLELKSQIAELGQLLPIRVRPAAEGTGFDYEIVFGHRRHAACLALDAEREGGFPVLALLDTAAEDIRRHVLAMYQENAAREDLSAYETGRMFQSWLDERVFATNEALGDAVGVTKQLVGMYLSVYALPAPVIEAFRDPRTISLRWQAALNQALGADRSAVLSEARRLASVDPPLAPEAVLRALTSSASASANRPQTREESVKVQGKVALRLKRRDGTFSVKLGKIVGKNLHREFGEDLKDFATAWLSKRLGGKGP